MADVFNPYQAFLGLEGQTSPDYYQLLRLRESETDHETIAAAADRAVTRVRSHRPGPNAVAWSRLLDEIQAARSCLLDPAKRQEYNERLPSQSPLQTAPGASEPSVATGHTPSMAFESVTQPAAYAYPPGRGPKPAETSSVVAPDPQAPAQAVSTTVAPSPVYPNPAAPAYANPTTAGFPAPTMPISVAPIAAGFPPTGAAANWPSGVQMPPGAYAWNAPQSTTAYAAPGAALDPMAPFSYAPRADVPQAYDPQRAMSFPSQMNVAQAYQPQAVMTPAAAQQSDPFTAASPVQVEPRPAMSSPPARTRGDKGPLVLLLGVGGSLLVLAGLIYYGWSKLKKEVVTVVENPAIVAPQPKPGELPATKPDLANDKPTVTPGPVPMPEPVAPTSKEVTPAPEPVPDPEMKPETVKPEAPTPKPEPGPEPSPPPTPPDPKPTAEELVSLTQYMKEAKASLAEMDFDQAEVKLASAEMIARLPEHRAKVERLKEVSSLARQFHAAIGRTMQGLQVGDEIRISNSTQAVVVESSPTELKIRLNAQNQTHSLDKMPLGLGLKLGEQSLDQGDPTTRVLKGAYVFIHPRGDISKAKTWWEEAQLSGRDLAHLLPVLADKYDFEKDLPNDE